MVLHHLSTRATRSLTLLGVLALGVLSTIEVSAQTGLAVRAGQPDGLTFGVDGRLTLEAAAYAPIDKDNFLYSPTGSTASAEAFRMAPGTSITQARIGFFSTYQNWKGRIDVNFAGQRVSFCDIFVNYSFNPRTSLTLGHILDPFSMGVNTASRHSSVNTPIAMDFLARGERHWGITATHFGQHYWLSGGLYAGSSARLTAEPNHAGEGYGASLRAVYRPLNDDSRTLHFGVSATTRAPEQTQNSLGQVNVGVHPGSSVDGRDFISGTLLGVYRYDLLGGEIAYRDDRFFAIGEYLYAGYNTDTNKAAGIIGMEGNREVTSFHGGYLTGSVMLRGKQRRYLSGDAAFANTHSTIAPGGNLELLGRVGYLAGGEAGSALEALGAVNWYPNRMMMLGLSYTYTGMDEKANAGGTLIPRTGGMMDGLKLNTIQLRAQFVF